LAPNSLLIRAGNYMEGSGIFAARSGIFAPDTGGLDFSPPLTCRSVRWLSEHRCGTCSHHGGARNSWRPSSTRDRQRRPSFPCHDVAIGRFGHRLADACCGEGHVASVEDPDEGLGVEWHVLVLLCCAD
jgi:hypothetical protein